MWIRVLMLWLVVNQAYAINADKMDVQKTQDQIRQLKSEKKWTQAESLSKQYLAQYPNDADVQVQLASIYYQEQRYAEAKTLLESVKKTYPNDTDATDLLILVDKKIHSQNTQTLIEPQKSASVFAPSNLQATNILNSVVTDYSQYGYGPNQIGINQQSIYGTSPDGYWDFTNLYYTRLTEFGMVLGSLNYASRFGDSALQGAMEAIVNVTDKIYLDLNLAYANNLHLFPDWTLGGEVYYSIFKDLQVSAGDLYRVITPTFFNTFTGSIQKYAGDYLFVFRPYVYVPKQGVTSIFYTATVRRYFESPDHSIAATFGYGVTPDLADLTSVNFITIDDRSVAVVYEFPLMENRLVMDIGLSYENQRFPSGTIRQLTGADVGLRVRF